MDDSSSKKKMRKVLDLIKKWMNLDHQRPWEKESPDIITGWNVRFFDIP